MEISRWQAFKNVFFGNKGAVVILVALILGVVGTYDDIRNLAPFLPEALKVIDILPSFFWFVLGLLVIAYIVFEGSYHYTCAVLRTASNSVVTSPVLSSLTGPKKVLFSYNRNVISTMDELVRKNHGHSDIDGLESDVRDGVLSSDLPSRDCAVCGKPRKQKVDYSNR